MSTRIPFQWNTANFKWDAINPTDDAEQGDEGGQQGGRDERHQPRAEGDGEGDQRPRHCAVAVVFLHSSFSILSAMRCEISVMMSSSKGTLS